MRLPRKSALLLIVATLAYAFAAPLYALDYEAQVNGETRRVSVDALEIGGVTYLPVDALCAQLGGSCESIASQMRVNIGGQSAVLVYGEAEVHSSLGSFILANPVKKEGALTYVAVNDANAFFRKAFGMELAQSSGLAPINPEMLEEQTAGEEEVAPDEEAPPLEAITPEETPIPENENAKTLNAAVIILDAGHGGRDIGYTANNNLTEKDLALKISERLMELLKENSNSKLYATRREDKDLSNKERVKIANENSGSIFISIHAGVSRSPQANGVDLYITDAPLAGQARAAGATPQNETGKIVEYSRILAQAIADGVAAEAGVPVRGIRQAPLRLLNELSMPGVLIEIGYLSNAAESELLMQDAHLDKIARGVWAGIQKATGKEAPQP